jgi:hypothetical protein
MRTKQISVFLENKRGRLAEVTRLLGKSNVNIRALSIAETVDYGVLRLVVSDPERARTCLADEGFTVTDTDVIAVEIPDKPGSLTTVIEPLAEACVNVEYLYAFVGKSGESAVVVLRVEDIDRAVELLQRHSVRVLKAAEVYSL